MEDYVTFEQAIKLKELGFDLKTHAFYNKVGELYSSDNPDYWNDKIWDEISAPTLSQVQKWMYEKFGIWVDPTWSIIEHKFRWVARWIGPLCNGYNQEISNIIFDNPFEALSSGIDRVLEILKM